MQQTSCDAPRIQLWRRVVLAVLRVHVRYAPNVTNNISGRVIVTCNHQSMLDGVIIALAAPVPMTYAVNTHHATENVITSRILTTLARLGLGKIVAVDSAKPSAMRALLSTLRGNQAVMIFPEGAITQNGQEQAHMPGLEWLVKKTGATVYNLKIQGAGSSRFFGKSGQQTWPKIELDF